MTCCCSLAGTAACSSCLHNPGASNPQFNNFITWTYGTYPERERTCKVVSEEYDELLDHWKTELSCGHVFYGMAEYVNFCPNCGAKVVE